MVEHFGRAARWLWQRLPILLLIVAAGLPIVALWLGADDDLLESHAHRESAQIITDTATLHILYPEHSASCLAMSRCWEEI